MKKRLTKYFILIFICSYIHPALASEMVPNNTLPDNSSLQENKITPGDKLSKEKADVVEERQEKKVTSQQDEQQKASITYEGTHSSENTDDSVLSFNFLHYIIQKFKFSDVITQ